MRRTPPGSVAGAPPALVLLHGFALDSRMWRRQLEELQGEFRILTVDLPGFGAQARAPKPSRSDVDPAAETARAMNAGGLARAHLVGFDYGGAVAIDFALRFPGLVESITLVGPLLLGRVAGLESWGRCVALAEEGDCTTAAEVWLDDPLYETVRDNGDLFEEVRQIVLDYGGAHWTGRIVSAFGVADPSSCLKDISAPSMAISGEADLPSYMLMAEAYATGIRKARREILKGIGHNVTLEHPGAFHAMLRDFLGSL